MRHPYCRFNLVHILTAGPTGPEGIDLKVFIIDDNFTIAIDSMLDRRNAFAFWINPLGAKSEARLEDNSIFRMEWNGIWYGGAQRGESGWSAEFAIPFKTLSLDGSSEIWGLEMERFIRRRNEYARWAASGAT